MSLTLLKGFAEAWYLTGIAQAWSLTVEKCFYLLAPLVFWLGWCYRPARTWPLLALAAAALGLVLYAAVPALGTLLFGLKATIFGRLPEFLVGAAFGWVPLRPPQPAVTATLGGAAGVLRALGLLVAVQRLTGQVSIATWLGALANNLLLPLGTGWLLRGLCAESTWLSGALGSAAGQALGRASYCFYLLHMGVLPEVLKPRLLAGLPGAAGLLVLFAGLVLASLMLHRWGSSPLTSG